ncbi:MAG: hypothetical protein AAGC55_00730 [Myxococcota bacterium]
MTAKPMDSAFDRPLERLRPLAAGVWCAEHDHYWIGLHFRTRMTVVAVRDGLVLISPIPIDDELAGDLDRLGPVRHLIAPNLMHHVYLPAAAARYPEATCHGPEGLTKKRPDVELVPLSGDSWGEELRVCRLPGAPQFDEHVLYEPNSQSLIVTDFLAHVTDASNWPTRLLFRFDAVWQRTDLPRIVRWAIKDKAALRSAADELLSWPIARVVPAHGEVISDDAQQQLSHGWRHLD